jgi:beta-glucosidase
MFKALRATIDFKTFLQGYPPVSFNTQAPDGSGPLNENVNVRSDAHTLLVREIASASAVLLKNNQTTSGGVTTRGLPITKSMINTVAIVGQDAKQLNQQCTGGLNECNDGTMVIGYVSFEPNVVSKRLT